MRMPCGPRELASGGWRHKKTNILRVLLLLYPPPTPSTLPRGHTQSSIKNHVPANDENAVLFQRMSSLSGFPVIADAPILHTFLAKNFTIKEVPIPQVKGDEVLLKGTVLFFFHPGHMCSCHFVAVVTYCGLCGVCIHDFISTMGN